MGKKLLCLVVVFCFLLATVPGCKTAEEEWSILGTWVVAINIPPLITMTANVSFSGSENAGTAIVDGVQGTFSKNNKQVTFPANDGDIILSFTGSFSDKNAMNGAVTAQDIDTLNTLSGTWTATK